MKKLIIIAGLAVVCFFGLSILKNQVIKTAVIIGANKVLGTKVEINKFSFCIVGTSISIKGFKLYNPKGFPEGVMVDVPEVTVDYSLIKLLQKKLYLKKMVLKLNDFVVVKNQDGKLNVDALKVSQEKEAKEEPKEKEVEKKKSDMQIQIDYLNLQVGRVVYKTYKDDKADPSIKVFNVGINREYKNITSVRKLALLILVEPMKAAAIKGAMVYGVASVVGTATPVGMAVGAVKVLGGLFGDKE